MDYRDQIREQVIDLWDTLHKQSWDKIYDFFQKDAVVYWNNTNEQFDVNDFVRANSQYPGNWSIEIERLESFENVVISVVKVQLINDGVSFHATSFFEFMDEKIQVLNEYWGDDGSTPQWRIDKKIGKPIESTN